MGWSMNALPASVSHPTGMSWIASGAFFAQAWLSPAVVESVHLQLKTYSYAAFIKASVPWFTSAFSSYQ